SVVNRVRVRTAAHAATSASRPTKLLSSAGRCEPELHSDGSASGDGRGRLDSIRARAAPSQSRRAIRSSPRSQRARVLRGTPRVIASPRWLRPSARRRPRSDLGVIASTGASYQHTVASKSVWEVDGALAPRPDWQAIGGRRHMIEEPLHIYVH